MSARKKTVQLTDAQIEAALSALGSYLNAGTADECRTVFGSASGTAAAQRAFEVLRAARYR